MKVAKTYDVEATPCAQHTNPKLVYIEFNLDGLDPQFTYANNSIVISMPTAQLELDGVEKQLLSVGMGESIVNELLDKFVNEVTRKLAAQMLAERIVTD